MRRSAAASRPAASLPVRVLRWTFRRDADLMSCALGLDRHDCVYELTVVEPGRTDARTETFADAIAALQRQAQLEQDLVNEGWSLEAFGSETMDPVA